jgi:hypothetical protein
MAISAPLGETQRIGFHIVPILSGPLCYANTIGAAIFTRLKVEA